MKSKSAFIRVILIAAATTATAAGNVFHQPLHVEIESVPERVDPARYFFVKLTVTIPHKMMDVQLPHFNERFEGFAIAGVYHRREDLPNGRHLLQSNLRLRPQPGASNYRMAPLALAWNEKSANGDITAGYQMVPAVYFKRTAAHPPYQEIIMEPRRLPFFYERSHRLVLLFALIPATFALIVFIRRRQRKRLTACITAPRLQAHAELQELLQKQLPEKGLFVAFYSELTMIVKRYVERSFHITASRQTTREFLAAAARDKRLQEKWTIALRNFLEHADRVKYAAQGPDPQTVAHAVKTVRKLLDTAATGEHMHVANG